VKIEFDKNNYVVCEGITLPLTREQIMDMQSYGYDAQNVIEDFYRNNKAYVREQKIDFLLKNPLK
jgi:hypothetical protein